MPNEFELHTELPFRRYSGSTVEDVIRVDPNYIRWCLGNVNGFKLSEMALNLLNAVDPQ